MIEVRFDLSPAEITAARAAARAIVGKINPMLAEQPVWIQGVVLADLLSDFLTTNTTGDDRPIVLRALLETVEQLIAVSEVAGHA